MTDQLDSKEPQLTAQRDDPARKMQERRQAKERRSTKVKPTPPPPPIGERRQTERRANHQAVAQKPQSGLLSKLTFVLVLGVIGGAGFTYYQQDLMVKSLSQTNESTNARIAELEAQLRASDTLLEQTEDVATSSINLTKNEIRTLRQSSNQNNTRSTNNEKDVTEIRSTLSSIDNKITSLTTRDTELSKKDDGLRWLANQAKNQADEAQTQLKDIESKIGRIDTLSKKVAAIDGLAVKVAQIDAINNKIAVIDELEVAIDSIKPTDTSAIENNQIKIINAQNALLNDQVNLSDTQSDIKLALELISERINQLEEAVEVIDNHRLRIQQDLADLKQTP